LHQKPQLAAAFDFMTVNLKDLPQLPSYVPLIQFVAGLFDKEKEKPKMPIPTKLKSKSSKKDKNTEEIKGL